MAKTLDRWSKGFTLIEMLVVIAIISILIGIGVNTFTIAQKKARDVRRKADLHQMQVALEAYAVDHNGNYPSTGASWWGSEPLASYPNNSGDWIPGLVAGGYIKALPKDPLGGLSNNSTSCSAGNHYREYRYVGDGGQNYKLQAFCSIENSQDSALTDPNDPLHSNYSAQWAGIGVCSGTSGCGNSW